MTKKGTFGFSILFLLLLLSCSKNSSLETPEAKSAIEVQKISNDLSDSLKASEIKSILHRLDYGTDAERKSIPKLLGTNQQRAISSLTTLQTNDSSQEEAMTILNNTTSYSTNAEWDEYASLRNYFTDIEMGYDHPSDQLTTWKYKWTVAYNIGHWFFVKSQERFILKTNPDRSTFGTPAFYIIAQPTTHDSSYIEGFSAGILWTETSNLHYDGIHYVYLSCEGMLRAWGVSVQKSSARYCSLDNIVKSGGKNISSYN